MTNALYYCSEKVAPLGSDWYYCLRNTSADKRELLLALLTLAEEWQAIPAECHEMQIAQTKFAWWQQELKRCYEGNPQHPATQLFFQKGGIQFVSYDELHQVLTAYQDRLNPVIYQTQSEWRNQPLLKHNVLLLIARILNNQQELPLDYLAKLVEANAITDHIIHLKKMLVLGECPFSAADLVAAQVEITDLQQLKETDQLKTLLQQQSEAALRYFKTLPQLLSKSQQKKQKALLRYATLQAALLKEIAAAHFPVLQVKTLLTPLRKLWLTAFR